MMNRSSLVSEVGITNGFLHVKKVRSKSRKSRYQGKKVRTLSIEQLEHRRLLVGDWHNAIRPADVDADGLVAPIDALVVINELKRRAISRPDSSLPPITSSLKPPPYLDVDADDFVSPQDVLRIINVLNRRDLMPTVSVVLSQDTSEFGVANNDLLTSVATVRGQALDDNDPIKLLEYSLDNAAFASTPFDANGNFTIAFGLSNDGSTDGPHAVRVRATDLGGLVSQITTLNFTLDTLQPTTPTLALDPLSDSAPLGDHQTNLAQVTLRGSTSPTTAVRLTPSGIQTISDQQGNFSFDNIALNLGANDFTATASDRAGNLASFTRTITRIAATVAPPTIAIDGATMRVTNGNITITGKASSTTSTIDSLLSQIDLGDVASVLIAADGTFTFSTSLPSNGTADGSHVVRFRASDVVGNISPLVIVNWKLDTQRPSLTTTASGTIRDQLSTIDLVFNEEMSAAAYAAASYALVLTSGANAGQSLAIASVSKQANNTARLQLANALENLSYRLSVTAAGVTDLAGNRLAITSFDFSVAQPTRLAESSPASGEEMVSLTRETVIRFDNQVNPATISPESFYLIANGERVPGHIRVSSTERFATFFYDTPLPASTAVRIMVDGNKITGRDGLLLDADNDGQPGGILQADFRTLPLTYIPGTRIFGNIFDSYNRNPDGSDIPVVGARISLDANPNVFAVADVNGFFELGLQDLDRNGVADGLPAPEFFVHIDGSAATNAPAGTAYATLGKPFHTIPGQRTQLSMAGTPFNIYLPPMSMGDVVTLNPNADTEVGFGPAAQAQIRAMFASDPAKAQLVIDTLKVTYPAGSAQSESGVAATRATIIPVSPDRLPAPLPLGANPSLVISVQAGTTAGFNLAGGSTNFDSPAPVQFPNLEGLATGEKVVINSFDHDAGGWRPIGTATVSQDGRTIVSDPGVGILAPGWHYLDRLVDVLGLANTPKSADVALTFLGVKNDLLFAFTSLTKANVITNGGNLALGLVGLQNDLLTGASRGYSTAERIGLVADIAGITAAGIVVVGASAGVALPLIAAAGTYATYAAIAANLFIIGDTLRGLAGVDPPCAANVRASTAGDLAVAASLCTASAATNLQLLTSSSQRAETILASALDTLLSRSVSQRFGNSNPNAQVEIATDGRVRVVDVVTGNTAIDPITGQAYNLTLADIIPSSLDNAEEQSLRDLISPGSLPDVIQAVNRVNDGGILTSVSNAIALNDRAIESLFVPADNSFLRVGSVTTALTISGAFHLRLAANRNYSGELLDGNSGFVKTISFTTGGPGSTLRIPTVLIDAIDTNDTDGDGLGDVGESIVGTFVTSRDSDGDGIDDFSELKQRLNPLDGLAFPTGIVAIANLNGNLKDVIVVIDARDSKRRLALVASGVAGLGIVDASKIDQPVTLGQLMLLGDSQDVDVDSLTSTAVVASGEGGLHFVDVSDPMLPRETRTVSINATQVEIVDGVAYASAGSRISAYDPVSGDLLSSFSVPNSGVITGLAHEGNFLYAIDAALKLHVLEVARFQVQKRGVVQLPQGGSKLSVNNGIVYVGAQPSYLSGGFVTVNVTNPASPTVISGSDVGSAFITPGTAIVPNGSGLGLAIGRVGASGNRPVVSIVDVSNPQVTDSYLTQFDLPTTPQSVAIASGIGYVADGTGGLVVVNYVPFDNKGIAPTVTATGPTGTTIQEGSFVSIRTAVTDDVQVREVELLMNGRVVARDVSAPFDLRAVTPKLSDASPTVSFQVRATDTGGNVGLSSVLTYTLTPDITPPAIINSTPSDNGAGFRINAITLRFDEPIDSTRLSVTGFTLTNLGNDFRVGGSDDTSVAIDRIQALSPTRIVVYPLNPLPEGTFRLTGDASVIADVAGNQVTSPIGITFTSLDFDEANSVAWNTDSDGNWNDPGNWNTGEVPRPNDKVIIDRKAANPTIRITGGNVKVTSLISREAIVISGGSLTVTQPSVAESRFEIGNGATLTADGRTAIFVANGETKIDGANLNAVSGGAIRLSQASSFTHNIGTALNTVRFRASGLGSLLDLGNLRTLTGGDDQDDQVVIEALSGGRVDLHSVTDVIDPSNGDLRGRAIQIT
ncbi:MAG: Ig-like domain-containing protein, partial [Pirellulaceae bacterium]|nr:Ig-like domain-containing protein [Pirellulaceae bacterium]